MTTELSSQSQAGARFRSMVTSMAETMLGSIADERGAKLAGQRLALALRTAAQSNPEIYSCTPASVAECVANSALTELLPGGPLPHVYLIPRRVKGSKVLTWMPSFRGLVRMAERSGYRVRATPVDEGDDFSVALGLHRDLTHTPVVDPEWSTLRGVYVTATPIGGGEVEFVWMPKAQIEKRRKSSAAGGSGPWRDWPVEMSLKTALRYAINRGLVPIEDPGLMRALSADNVATSPSIDTTATPVVSRPSVASDAGMGGLAAALAPPVPEPVAIQTTADIVDPVDAYATMRGMSRSQHAALQSRVAKVMRSGAAASREDAIDMVTSDAAPHAARPTPPPIDDMGGMP